MITFSESLRRTGAVWCSLFNPQSYFYPVIQGKRLQGRHLVFTGCCRNSTVNSAGIRVAGNYTPENIIIVGKDHTFPVPVMAASGGTTVEENGKYVPFKTNFGNIGKICFMGA